jgi:hypothetical protein
MACTLQITRDENRACCKPLRGVTPLHGDFKLPFEHDYILPGWRIMPTEEIARFRMAAATITTRQRH